MMIYPMDWQYEPDKHILCSYCGKKSLVHADGNPHNIVGEVSACKHHLWIIFGFIADSHLG